MENIAQGVSVLVVGMAVVFAVLIILMIVTSTFKFIFKDSSVKEEKKTAPVAAAKPVAAAPAAEFKPGFDTEDGELVAVIAASISAALNTESGDIKIRSIRKVN